MIIHMSVRFLPIVTNVHTRVSLTRWSLSLELSVCISPMSVVGSIPFQSLPFLIFFTMVVRIRLALSVLVLWHLTSLSFLKFHYPLLFVIMKCERHGWNIPCLLFSILIIVTDQNVKLSGMLIIYIFILILLIFY